MKIQNNSFRTSFIGSVILASLALTSCGGSGGNSEAKKTYKISVTNVTANQALSPAAIVLHTPSYHIFQAGDAASVALEKLAESGDNKQVLSEAKTDSGFLASSSSEHIAPGETETIELSISEDEDSVYISVASMLVDTNDAFVGVASDKIESLGKGESFSMHVPVWDAGTEANTETADTIPGPAGGGEGFNASRAGDANFVGIHQGVITSADGLATSVLGESHRFDNPGAMLRVERMQ